VQFIYVVFELFVEFGPITTEPPPEFVLFVVLFEVLF